MDPAEAVDLDGLVVVVRMVGRTNAAVVEVARRGRIKAVVVEAEEGVGKQGGHNRMYRRAVVVENRRGNMLIVSGLGDKRR